VVAPRTRVRVVVSVLSRVAPSKVQEGSESDAPVQFRWSSFPTSILMVASEGVIVQDFFICFGSADDQFNFSEVVQEFL